MIDHAEKQPQLPTQALENLRQKYHWPILFISIDNPEQKSL